MEIVEDIVIAGAGLAGLTTALGLHRLGIRSLVLESSEGLRTAGYAILIWNNAWKALDAVGVGDALRQQHAKLQRYAVCSLVSGEISSEILLKDHEARCLKRNLLIESLGKELPKGTIRFSSKVVSIEESCNFKLVHLADGTIIKTKVLIGCDGVNSVVAKWLGLEMPVNSGRSAIRAYVDTKGSHGFEKDAVLYFGNGVRLGFVPCDDQTAYWFLTYSSRHDKELGDDHAKLKQFAMSNLGKLPDNLKSMIENTRLENIITSPIKYRRPWELFRGNISKGNVCVAGDALHPMVPDIGQGGCSALEDGVVLARCLGEALMKPGEEEWKRIEMGLEKYARERRWRSIELMSAAYTVGAIQQSGWKVMNFVRDKFLNKVLVGVTVGRAGFDCGKLTAS